MSEMIECDKCKKKLYKDSRSNKGDYCKVGIDYWDGYSSYHLCKVCFRQFYVEFTRLMTPEEFDEQYGEEI